MTGPGRGFTAELAAQDDPEIGRELILVRCDDGRVRELRLHDYEAVYELPGLYEQIVSERLGCRSPQVLAGMLGAAVDALGCDRGEVRVLDVAAGNGVSGEALAAAGLGAGGRYGTDIVAAARAAALRDRPAVYDLYLTLDLLALSGAQRARLADLRCRALSCVAPVGDHVSQLPPAALAAAAALLAPDALVVYMHDPGHGVQDPVTDAWWRRSLGEHGLHVEPSELARERYLHRYTVNGGRYEMDGVVWRLRRAG